MCLGPLLTNRSGSLRHLWSFPVLFSGLPQSNRPTMLPTARKPALFGARWPATATLSRKAARFGARRLRPSLAQTCFAATSVVHYWGAAPTPAALACYQHIPARTASASGCSRPATVPCPWLLRSAKLSSAKRGETVHISPQRRREITSFAPSPATASALVKVQSHRPLPKEDILGRQKGSHRQGPLLGWR